MKLRDHPLIHSASAWNWPPVWTGVNNPREIICGEVGVLKKVTATGLPDYKFYLVIEQEKTVYFGSLVFDDIIFAGLLFTIFRENVGRTIEQIGAIDLSFTL